MKLYGEYFCGNRISDYGIENGYLDYATLAKSFGHVLNNEIVGFFDFDVVSGDLDKEVAQWYIIDPSGAETLIEIGEVVLYASEIDLYLWGVTHWGTAWNYVLTDVPCNTGEF